MTDTSPSETATATPLSAIEIRVLGVLVEKSFVTPDVYPLSLNAIVSGCNQLTGRDPVMSLSDEEVRAALASLIERRLVAQCDQAGARVAKYEHLLRLRYSIAAPEQAALATLMLRGPQTSGEIRQRSERMDAFADLAAVEAALERLGNKYPPLVTTLPRLPGTKEARHAQLLAGDAVLAEASAAAAPAAAARPGCDALEAEVQRLRTELDALRAEFEAFRARFD